MGGNETKAFIFDLDGTIYLGDKIIPGAIEAVEWVRKNGGKVRFVTNNPRFSREFYQNKLTNLGITTQLYEIVTSAQVTATYLKENARKYGSLFMIGEEQLRTELIAANLQLVETDPDTVIVSFDTALDYEKLMVAYHALKKGAHFVATNPDAVCPTPEGGLVDAGAIIAALEVSTGRKMETVIGKPSPLLAELLLSDLDVKAENCVVVGDRLNTDVHLGKQAGMGAVWIRAHEEALPTEDEYEPDYMIKSIAELPEALHSHFIQGAKQ